MVGPALLVDGGVGNGVDCLKHQVSWICNNRSTQSGMCPSDSLHSTSQHQFVGSFNQAVSRFEPVRQKPSTYGLA
jgi:hypothetical protein